METDIQTALFNPASLSRTAVFRVESHRQKRPMLLQESAVTLMELLVTVIIIGILSATVSFSFSKVMQKSEAKQMKMYLLQIKAAQAVYHAKRGYYYPYTPVHGGGSNCQTGFAITGVNDLGLTLPQGAHGVCINSAIYCCNQDLPSDFRCAAGCVTSNGTWGYVLTEADDMPSCDIALGPCPE